MKFNTSKRDFWKKIKKSIVMKAFSQIYGLLLKTCLVDIFIPSS